MNGIGIGIPNGTWDRYDGQHQTYKINGRAAGRVEVLISCCIAVVHRADGRWEKKITNSPAAARQYVEEVAA
jgi:hypothetical protein